MTKRGAALFVFVAAGSVALGQFGGYRGYGGGEIRYLSEEITNARQIPTHSTDIPMWSNAVGFEGDVFTFARIRRDSNGGGNGTWTTDTPDADLGLSSRLQQLTTIRTNPNGRYIRLTDPELFRYPFIYMVEPGSLRLSDPEIRALRDYLNNGGFLWLDDFWGDTEWANVENIFRRVFPDKSFQELPLTHPLYSSVYNITSKGQVPNIGVGARSEYTGITYEQNHYGDTWTVHHRGIFDAKGRLMVFATHNTDNGDGWEREGESEYFFEHFSEKISYPLGINVVYYAMTH